MRIHEFIKINSAGPFVESDEWHDIDGEIRGAIASIVWPPGSKEFAIPPLRHGSGVAPIKKSFQKAIDEIDEWDPEVRVSLVGEVRPGPVDAVRLSASGERFLVEWETGNVSSSHRSVNRMLYAITSGFAVGGVIIVPRSETLYPLLTDRIGNDRELAPYFPLWASYPVSDGLLGMYVVDYDRVDDKVPAIPKGTDGRALV